MPLQLPTTATRVSLLFQLIILIALQTSGEAKPGQHDSHWSYSEHDGPSHWCQMNPHGQCCGQAQSPIDIDEMEASLELYKPLTFINYSQVPSQMILSNNGHTLVLQLGENDPAPIFTGGGLSDYFVFDSLHFHWGKTNNVGSEHTLAGKRYPMEMHMVHYNSKYGTKERAEINRDGLAVVGILYKLSEKDNEALHGLTKALDHVKYSNETNMIREPFALSTLLPPRTDDFFRYTGSLTTPPCSEVVTWTVLDSVVQISHDQLSKFRSLRMRTKMDDHRDADPLVDNYRPTQSLHGRKIHARSTLAKLRAITSNVSSSPGVPRVSMATIVMTFLIFGLTTC